MSYTEIIEQRLHFLGFDQQTLATLKKFQSILEPSIDHILDRFYEQITHEPEIRALFSTKESIAAARNAQREHWIDILFSGDIGKAHFDNAERIGRTHERIGLSLGHYLGGYCIMMNQFLRVISDHFHEDYVGMTKVIHALNKAVFLDIDSVIDSYLEAKDQAIQKVLIQAEQFSDGLKKINCTVGKQATNHQTHLSALLSKAESLDQRALKLDQNIAGIKQQNLDAAGESNQELIALLQESAALLKANREIHTGVKAAVQYASQLSDQVNNLNSYYDKLQDEHKCHFSTAGKQPMYKRVKLFFTRRLPG